MKVDLEGSRREPIVRKLREHTAFSSDFTQNS
jgi:hypothetical protein